MGTTATGRPLGRGEVSLRLYPHRLASARAVLDELEHQAALAERAGFDGVLLSERHGGAWGQIPNPLQVAGFLLAATERSWVAPCPLLLPLRRAAIVAEEVAWLAARHDGRVGIGFGSGGNEADFALVGVPYVERASRFDRELRRVVAILRCREGYGEDLAVRDARAVPVVSAAMSATAARRAAELGIGIIGSSLLDVDRTVALVEAYRRAGGTEPHVVIVRVWLGDPPEALMRKALEHYRDASSEANVRGGIADVLLSDDDPAALAESVASHAARCRADSLNLRIHVAGLDPLAAREQIEAIGTEVVPRVRARWSA